MGRGSQQLQPHLQPVKQEQQQQADDDSLLTAEARAQILKESTQQCQAVLDARDAMLPDDRKQVDAMAERLRSGFSCNSCAGVLLEPWLVKDCGHLFCFRCLHGLVYDHKVRLLQFVMPCVMDFTAPVCTLICHARLSICPCVSNAH